MHCCLLEIDSRLLEATFDDKLSLPRLTVNERRFLSDYCKVLGPLARALDIFQEENAFLDLFIKYILINNNLFIIHFEFL